MKRFIYIIFILTSINTHPSYCQTWQHYDSLRAVYEEKISYDTALFYADKALQSVKEIRGENDTLYANMLRAKSGLDYYSGKYENAIVLCKKEIEIRKALQGRNHIDYATSLNDLANLYDETGNYPAAIPIFLEEKDILKEIMGEKNVYYARCLNDLAETHWEMGNYIAAEPMYIESKNIRKEILGEKDPDYAISLNNLAVLYQEMGIYPAAEALYTEAKNIIKEVRGEKTIDYALALNNLAVLYWAMGNYHKAEPLFIESGNIYREVLGKKHPDYAISLNNLAKLYQAMENYTAAEPLFLESMNIRYEILGDKHPDYATSLNNLAGLYDAMGRYKDAEPLYLKAKMIRKEVLGEKHPDYATSLYNIARLYNLIGNYSASDSYYLDCLDKINSAIFQNFAFLSENEKEMYFKTRADYFESFYGFSLKRKKDDPEITKIVFNNVVKNKGLLLKSSTAMRTAVLNSNDTSLISKYEKWIGIKKEISRLYSTEISGHEKNPEELEQQANTIEKDLVRGSQVFSDFQDLQKLTWESVRDNLKHGEAAVEFIHFAEDKKRDTVLYCALVITPKSKHPEMIQLFYEKDLENILGNNNSNNSIYINSIYGTNQNSSERLYNLIWKPLEKYLKGVKTVYYSPDGLLHKISFAALSQANSIYLCDRYNLNRLSTTGKLYMRQKYSLDENLTAGIFGGIEYSADSIVKKIWPYLPGTKNEADEIDQIFKSNKLKTNYFSGKSATESSFKQMFSSSLANQKPGILHIATHGFFYPDPELLKKEEKNVEANESQVVFRGGSSGSGLLQFVMNKNPLMRSGLIFSGADNVWNQKYSSEKEDGVLTAQEVSQLDLGKTELVVLSACETALGDIKGSEGVYGLQRAFKMAGARYLIMSLWQVPDDATSEFMTQFYKKLINTKDIQKSFIETELEMRKKYDPYYWAAFVLIE